MQCSFHEALSIKYMQLLWGTLQCNFHRSIDMLLGGDQHALGRVSTCLGGGGGVGINMPWEGGINMSWGGGGGERGLTCLGKEVHALGGG